jgi:hypothetical protein
MVKKKTKGNITFILTICNYVIQNRFTSTKLPKENHIRLEYKANITQKTKDRATRTPLKTGGELRCYRRVSSSCSTCDTRRATAKRHEHHLTWTSPFDIFKLF